MESILVKSLNDNSIDGAQLKHFCLQLNSDEKFSRICCGFILFHSYLFVILFVVLVFYVLRIDHIVSSLVKCDTFSTHRQYFSLTNVYTYILFHINVWITLTYLARSLNDIVENSM